MRNFYKILIIIIIYALLAIPDNRNPLNIPMENNLAVSSKWWGKFAQNLVKFRITNELVQQYYYTKHRTLLNHHLDELLLQLTEPNDPIIDSISFHINKLSALASLLPTKINEFENDVARWRKLLKYQSRFWDTSSKSTHNRLFQLITESRLAFESSLIQSNTKSTSLQIVQVSSSDQSIIVNSLQFKSGDIIAFNLTTKNDPYVSYIRELPNIYKHLGMVYVKDTVASVIYIDHKKGIKIIPIQKFAGKLAPNGIILRLRNDIPSTLNTPDLPSLVASYIYKMAMEGKYRYDFNFDSETQDLLYDWELINSAYKTYNLNLSIDQYIDTSNSIHLGSNKSHLNAFEIEFDHRFLTAGEWYSSQVLYDRRLLAAATSSITRFEKKENFINPILLPIYRLVKGYSMFVGQLGLHEPTPSGITAQTQLMYDLLEKKQHKLVKQLEIELSKYESDQHHKSTYLKILQKSDEIKTEQ